MIDAFAGKFEVAKKGNQITNVKVVSRKRSMEYDAKNDLISYRIDEERLSTGQLHQIELVVTDNKDNVSHFRSTFFY